MCNKICFEKLKKQTTKIQIDEMIATSQDLVFGNQVDLNFLEKFDTDECCKNCEYNKNRD